jgi:major type 1 subunit fimbrin (pilin)
MTRASVFYPLHRAEGSDLHRERQSIKLSMLSLAIALPWPAFADCTFASGHSTSNVVLTLPPSLSIPRDAPVGYVAAQVDAPAGPSGISLNCTGTVQGFKGTSGTTTGASRDIAVTSVPGIGLRFYFRDNAGLSFGFSNPTNTWSYPYSSWQWNSNGTSYLGVQVVVTGTVGNGSINASPTASQGYGGATVSIVTIQTPITLNALSCTTPNVTVNMGNYLSSKFTGVGSTTSATSFNIALNSCPSGMNSIQYEIDPTTTIVPGTGNSVVTLDSKSTAKGIGLQLLDSNGNPFALGTQVTFNGYNSSSGGNLTIPLKARYYQTGTPVGAGSASTEMTFTMTYQ